MLMPRREYYQSPSGTPFGYIFAIIVLVSFILGFANGYQYRKATEPTRKEVRNAIP